MDRDKQQLDQFLANPLELLWFLGFFQQFHARHTTTVVDNVAAEVAGTAAVATASPALVDRIWLQFHYPVIKCYKYLVAQVYVDCRDQFEATHQYRPRAIEARKVYAEFAKLGKLVKGFYLNLARLLLRQYQALLVPRRVQARIVGSHEVLGADDVAESVQQVLALTIHRLVLALADVERHLVSVDHTYVRPCLSYKEWRQCRDAKGVDKLARLINDYGPALDYYHDCMRIMPTVGEPYNHIGMIYNAIDDRFTALYWFVRSQFTRTAHVDVAQQNFQALMTKGWFINQLSKVSLADISAASAVGIADVNNMLVLLCGFVYMPEVYVKGRSAQGAIQFINGIPHLKMESLMLTVLSRDYEAISTKVPDLFIQHLAVLIGFCHVIGVTRKQMAMKAIKRLTYRYIDTLFDAVATHKGEVPLALLAAMRLVLAWFKEDPSALSSFHERDQLVMALAKALNRLAVTAGWPTTRPARAYYFHEDVDLRDFSLINNRFRDCDDEGVFDNVDAMAGDFLALVDVNGPMFLPPGCLLVQQYEDSIRTAAILVAGDGVLEFNRAGLDKGERGYVYDAKKRKASKEPKPRKKNKKTTSPASGDNSYAAAVLAPPAAALPAASQAVAPSLSVLASIGPLVGPADSLEHIQTQMMNHIQDKLKAAETLPAAEATSVAESVPSTVSSSQPEETSSRVFELMVDSLVEDVARVTVDAPSGSAPAPVPVATSVPASVAPSSAANTANTAPVAAQVTTPLMPSAMPPQVQQQQPAAYGQQPPLLGMPQAYPQYQTTTYTPSALIWGPQYMSQYSQYQAPPMLLLTPMAPPPSMPPLGFPMPYGERKDDQRQWQFLQ